MSEIHTQEDQDDYLTHLRAALKDTPFTADRSRHESVTHASLWVFDESGSQIGSITYDPTIVTWSNNTKHWRVTAMFKGCATYQCFMDLLDDAVAYVISRHK